MNCELAHERIVTAAYGELPDEQMHELERHVTGCAECQQEREQLLALKVLADATLSRSRTPNLVARARLRLDEALDTLPPKRWYERLGQRIVNNFASLQAAPVGRAAAAGRRQPERAFWAATSMRRAARRMSAAQAAAAAAGQRLRPPPRCPNWPTLPASPASCAIPTARSSTSATTSSFRGRSRARSTIRPSASCSCWPAQNAASPGVRDDSVALLAAECRAGHSCQPSGIRDALMVALRYDKNAGVREKALEGLEPYVAEDMRVRDAVLEAAAERQRSGASAPRPSICWSRSRPIPASARCSIRSPIRTTIPRSGMFPGRS